MAASRNYSREGYAFRSATANQLNDDFGCAQPEPTSSYDDRVRAGKSETPSVED
jgi:hypothetical protein